MSVSIRCDDHPEVSASIPPPLGARPCALADALHVAQEADWAAATLTPMLDDISRWAEQLMASDRIAWQIGLRRFWSRHGWSLSGERRHALLELAYAWDDWPLLVRVGETLMRCAVTSNRGPVLMARAYWHCGETAAALDVLHPHLLRAPRDEPAFALYRAIHDWQEWRQRSGFADHPALVEEEFRLEPIGEHHLLDFAWQYHDPDIARLCCLPEISSDQHWLDWLAETHGYGDQLLFAVIHREWGFVGSVSLILHRGVGFFYYWVGNDFQGNGFGPVAVTMLLRMARDALGMHTCYAKAFVDNHHSHTGLRKLSFEPMNARAAAPNDDERFHRWGAALPEAQAIEELRTLLGDMGSDLHLCEPMPLIGWHESRRAFTRSSWSNRRIHGQA